MRAAEVPALCWGHVLGGCLSQQVKCCALERCRRTRSAAFPEVWEGARAELRLLAGLCA